MMFSMHWMSLKGMGGNMKHIAKFTVNLCDIMNGYIGDMIHTCIIIGVIEFLTIMVFSIMMITLS